jgi:arylformamidase
MNDTVPRKYTAQQLEAQYNARAAVAGYEKIFEKWRTRSAAYRRRSHCEVDVPYAPGGRSTLDLFFPRRSNAPVLVFIHGGYWRAMDKSDFSYAAEGLANGGALVAIVNYGRCPVVSIPDIIHQIRDACEWLWRNCSDYGGNPDAIHVSGHSAGGHLTAMMITTEWPSRHPDLPLDLVKSGVAVSGLFELEPLRHIPLNDDLKLDAVTARINSPVLLKPVTAAPLSIVVGGGESDEFRRQSHLFYSTWRDLDARVEYLELPGMNHFTVIDQMHRPDHPLTETLLRHMGLA